MKVVSRPWESDGRTNQKLSEKDGETVDFKPVVKFFNPMTKKIEPKEMYWEKHDNLVFACGAYKAGN